MKLIQSGVPVLALAMGVGCGSSGTASAGGSCDGGDASCPKLSNLPPKTHDAGHDVHEAHEDADVASQKDATDGESHDAGVDAPLHVPPLGDGGTSSWNFSYITGSACLDGSETGFGINVAPKPTDDLLIFLEGGGACWDGTTCWGPVTTAFYVATGYGSVEFATDPQVDLYVLDRTNTSNPFANMNMAFIPYCTGDVLDGSKVTTLDYLGVSHDTHFVGHDNMQLFVAYIAATFPNATHIWLAGDSAGGFGTALNFELVQGAFPHAHVDVLDDSGQPIQPAAGRWSMWIDTWNAQLPASCPACKTDPGAFVDYFSTNYPTSRFGLISYQDDIVISPFMDITLAQFNTELLALASDMDTHWPNGKYFIISASGHVGLLDPTATATEGGTEEETWVQQMVSGSSAWASQKP